ncbi:hypothetical protein L2E82_40774 [Cichorium intybus]|uniref:Uncharacterized protein n=1 Tax=Cichorium intybus TaxID=13427 RepID=A0ACB9ALP6_CICIN|nr:hypothetical protein L2E82_40774 [Cichorium intybus]
MTHESSLLIPETETPGRVIAAHMRDGDTCSTISIFSTISSAIQLTFLLLPDDTSSPTIALPGVTCKRSRLEP